MNKKGAFLASYAIDLLAMLLFVMTAIIFFILFNVGTTKDITATIQGHEQQTATSITLLNIMRVPFPDDFPSRIAEPKLHAMMEAQPGWWKGRTFGDFLQDVEAFAPGQRRDVISLASDALFKNVITQPTQMTVEYPDGEFIRMEFVQGVVVYEDKVAKTVIPLPSGKLATVTLYVPEASS